MKKISKRIFSVAISLMLVFLMTITSSAATITSLVAGVGTDDDRTVQVTVQYASPEVAQESTLLVVKKGVSIVTATADQVRYIDQKTVDGNSVTYTFKMAVGDRVGDYDLYVGGTKVDAPASTAISFSTDATTTIKFVKEDGTEITSQVLVSSNLGDIIDLTSYAPETITVDKSIYKKDATNPATFTVNATTNELTITYSYFGEKAEQIVINGTNYNIVGENLVPDGDFIDENDNFSWGTWFSPNGNNGPFANKCEDWFYKVNRDTNEAVLYTQTLAAEDYALGTRWNDPGDGLCSLANNIAVEAGKTYHVSFDYKHKNAGVDMGYITTTFVTTPATSADGSTVVIPKPAAATTSWQTASAVFTPTTDGYVFFHFRWLGDGGNSGNGPFFYFDNFIVEEITLPETTVDVTATYTFNGAAVGTVDKNYDSSIESGVDFDAYYYRDKATNFVYYAPAQKLSESTTIAMEKMAFKAVTLPTGSVTVDGSQYDVVGVENLVQNPSFETTDGNFSLKAWYSAQTKDNFGADSTADHAWKISPEKYYWLSETISNNNGTNVGTTFAPYDGWSFGGRWNDAYNGLCSLFNNIKVEANKQYYVSFRVKATTADDAQVYIGTVGSADANPVNATTFTIDNANAGEWTEFVTVVETNDTNNFIQFNAYNIGNNNNAGNQPYYLFDNIIIVEVEENKSDYATITVNYDYNGTTLATEVLEGVPGATLTAPAKTIEHNNGIVIFEAKDYTVGTTATTVTLTHSKFINLEGGLIANYNFANGDVTDAVNGFNGSVIGAAGVAFNNNGYVTLPGGIAQGALEIPAEIATYLTGDFTVSMWVKQDSSYASDGNAIAFWDIAVDNDNYDRFFWQQKADVTTVQHRGTPQTYTEYRGVNAMKDNWALVTASFDLDANTLTTYVNGVAVEGGTTKETWTTGLAPANIYNRANGAISFYLGHNQWNNGDNPEMKGDMADVRIYNKALTADEVAALMAAKKTVTVKYMADGAEITDSSAVEYFSASATFTIPTAVTGANGRAYALTGFDYAEGTESVTVTSANAEYVATYASVDAIPTGIKAIPAVTVISGNAPVLPPTVTVLTNKAGIEYTANVNWNTANLAVGANTVTGTVEGFDIAATVSVTVLENTFAIADSASKNGQPGNVVYFPVEIPDEFTMEFDMNIVRRTDVSVQMGYNGTLFSAAALGISPNGGALKVTGGSRNGSAGIGHTLVDTVNNGDTVRVLLTMDASTGTYSITVTTADGTTKTVSEQGFRQAQSAINTMTLVTNGSGSMGDTAADGDITVSNVKVSAPTADVETYTVNAVAGATTLGTFTGVASDTGKMGYNNEVIYPDVNIPSYDGYVFKNKTVSGNTVTLNYEAVEEASFFDNVANDTKFVSLNMLGAHDAFTAKIASNRKDAAGVTQEKNGSIGGSIGALTGAAVNKSIAQDQDVLTMLNYGVRYFDIRLSRSDVDASYLLVYNAPHTNGVIYTTHGYLGEEFRPIAYTIAQWAKAHPGEIVVLDFQEYWDNTNGGDGNSRADSWTDLNNLLKEAGIYDYVTINNGTNLADVTYGSLTSNGTKAGIVLFGRATATNANVGNFILRGTTSSAFDGKMYSNYSFGGASVSSALANTYIQAQVDHAYTNAGTVNNMYRVMQAISDSSNLINQATTDNAFITNAVQTNPTWLTTLPVIMVNNATVNTGELLEILKSCNEPIDVQMNYTTGGSVVDTNTTKLMVGTLYTGGVVNAVVNGANGEYAVTEALGETPVPYNGSITLEVEKLGNVYTMDVVNGVNIWDTSSNLVGSTYPAKENFAAFNWDGATSTVTDRIGVAILSVESGANAYALTGNLLRDEFNQTGAYVNFYAIPYSQLADIDLNSRAALEALFTAENRVAAYSPTPQSASTGNKQYVLDAAKINEILKIDDQIVIIGDSRCGLFGMEGKTMAIVSGYNVTINGGDATIVYGTYTLPSDAIAYHMNDTENVYKPGTTVAITADTAFTAYYALGANMVNGAQVRIGDGVDENGMVSTGSGLRFITTIDHNETLANLSEIMEVEMGVEVTAEDSDADPVVIKAENWQVNDQVFTSAITNLAEGNYNRMFTATPYIKIGENVFYGTSVTRSIYQVAAGLLVNSDMDNTVYDETALNSKILYAVLNAYVNQTGVRLTLSDTSETGTLTARTEGNGAYTGEAFFTVGATTYADGKYTVTLTAVGQSVINTDLFNKYVRINNNNKLVSPVTKITDNGDGTYTIVFDYSSIN